MYAIVDIETTGGSPSRHKITEIAIVLFDGEKVVDQWQSLVNPEVAIPPRIVRLNGITDNLVTSSPTFKELIPKIDELTKDCVFVAHNVNFDYAFLRNEYNAHYEKFQRKKLCTVRLSRHLLPNMPAYNLDMLCEKLDIEITQRHRALGDALATVELFKHLQELDTDDFIKYSLNQRSREAMLPPHLPKERFEALPKTLGVYYLHDQRGKIIYIGKAKNLRARVSTHFNYNTNTSSKQRFIHQIYDVTYEECGNELFAYLTEVHAIKQHWPIFNRSMKRIRLNYGIFKYYDRNGYGRLAVAETSKTNKGLISFRYLSDAWYKIEELIEDFELCRRLSGLQETPGACHRHEQNLCKGGCVQKEDAEAYNQRFELALEALLLGDESTYIIKEVGRNTDETAVVLVERGRYKGFGYAPATSKLDNLDEVREHLQYGYDDQDVQNIVQSYLDEHPNNKVLLQ